MKRTFDFVAALVGLVVLWPLIGAAMLAVRLETPGNPLFCQQRIGRKGLPFTCYKLRSMRQDTKNVPTHQVGATALTSVGRFLRRTKIDELPQLINVLKGEMSLVGPRPCLPSQDLLIAERRRQGALDVLPGITGLAQVQGIDMSDPVKLAAVDGNYVRTRTLAGDLKLILMTATGAGGGDPADRGRSG